MSKPYVFTFEDSQGVMRSYKLLLTTKAIYEFEGVAATGISKFSETYRGILILLWAAAHTHHRSLTVEQLLEQVEPRHTEQICAALKACIKEAFPDAEEVAEEGAARPSPSGNASGD